MEGCLRSICTHRIASKPTRQACSRLVFLSLLSEAVKIDECDSGLMFLQIRFSTMESLILAQNERWRRGLGMQVERESGLRTVSKVANG